MDIFSQCQYQLIPVFLFCIISVEIYFKSTGEKIEYHYN